MNTTDESPARAFALALKEGEDAALAFRKRIAPRTHHSDERQETALVQAVKFQRTGNLELAETWALRALHDGPSRSALCLLGDICEQTADLQNAARWYRLACAMSEMRRFDQNRYGLLSGLRAVDPAARLDAIEREARESWESAMPAREVHFESWTAYLRYDTREAGMREAARRNVPVVAGCSHPAAVVDRVRTAALDEDLLFIAWDVPLALPVDNKQEPFPKMMILEVGQVPMYGDLLTVSPKLGEHLGDGPYDDLSIARAFPRGRFGAYAIKDA